MSDNELMTLIENALPKVRGKKRYTRDDLANLKGMALATARQPGYLHRLPRFGVPDHKGQPYAWYLTAEELDQWLSTPESELDAAWAALPEDLRRKIVKARTR